jgi:murein L,D-transpeptidase YcbB/YkuD
MANRLSSRDLIKSFLSSTGLAVALFVTVETAFADVASHERADQFSRNILSTLTEDNAADLALLTQFYIERDMAPVWVNDEAPTERAHDLLHIFETSIYDGLNPQDYDIRTIRELMDARSGGELAELDLRLSLSLMQFLSDLGSGRTEPTALDPDLFVYPQDIDKNRAIRAASKADDIRVFVGGYRPRQIDYWRLKGVLATYRSMARTGGWPTVDPGPTLKEGERSARVAQLRARLIRGGDLEQPAIGLALVDRDLFDEALVQAVKAFQERHGLEQDGRVGPNTLRALNVPIGERIEQLVLNLERRRWMADRRPSRYINVNLADFHLELIDRGEVVFDTPVVIGSQYNKTPVFSANMTYLVVNPYWTVPKSIARRVILPKVKDDPGYLTQNGFDVFESWRRNASILETGDVDWTTLQPADLGSYKLRQRPGPKNALGQLKFMLPNEFDIYLHDTPNQSHFAENQRSFSNGCVRVADPEGLANAILQGQSGWTFDQIQEAVASGERTQINLDKALPVQISYQTAWVDDANRVHFRNDVYDRDQILADTLNNNTRQRGLFARGVSTEAHLDDIDLGVDGATAAQ